MPNVKVFQNLNDNSKFLEEILVANTEPWELSFDAAIDEYFARVT